MARIALTDRNLRFPMDNRNLTAVKAKFNDHDAVIDAAIGDSTNYGITVVTSGAIDPTKRITHMSTTGAQAYSMANGTVVGQRVVVRCTVTNAVGTLTPATPVGFATVSFDAVGEVCEFIWNGAAWQIGMISGATPA